MDMHKFRTQLLATAAVLALSGAAYAADMPVKAPPPVAAPVPYTNWTGFYAGLQFGGASLDSSCSTHDSEGFISEGVDSDNPCNPTSFSDGKSLRGSSSSISSAGVLGGGKVGYDWQGLLGWDRVVLGVVGEFDWTDLNGTSRQQTFVGLSDCFPCSGTGTSTATANQRLDWLASARGRFGWAFDQVLFYATGGVAWAKFNESASLTGTNDFSDWAASGSTTKTGAVAGGGFEYRVTRNVSVVGEVLWYGFGTTSVSAAANTNLGHTVYTTSFRSNDIVAGTLGVNWRF
jgi:outer membrane immunogenic protein